MIRGIGIDIVEISRIERLCENEEFLVRVFTAAELEESSGYATKRRAEYLAGRFAAKEAFLKATGKGLRDGVKITEISVTGTEAGTPFIALSGRLAELWPTNTFGFHCSISHERDYATAFVIIELRGY